MASEALICFQAHHSHCVCVCVCVGRGNVLMDLFHTQHLIIVSSCFKLHLDIHGNRAATSKCGGTGAWLDCLSGLNEMCLQSKPTGASIPRTSLVRHEKKSGRITITRVLFFTVLQLDVRHQSLQPPPGEPPQRLTENGMLLASILHTLCSFSNPTLDRKHVS